MEPHPVSGGAGPGDPARAGDAPTIVLAVDDDEVSFRAAGAVTRWFRDDARVIALHVADAARPIAAATSDATGNQVVAGYPWAYPSMFVLDTAQAVERGRELAQRAAAVAGGVPRVEEGGAARMISAVASSVEADLIVVGTGDRSWLSRLFEASVSSYVVHHAPCSVLVVRDKDHD